MNPSLLYIKNMVCNRCIKVVKEEFEKLGFTISSIELGEVKIKEELSDNNIETIRKKLDSLGFELIDNYKSRIINQIKTLIIEQIHHRKEKDSNKNTSEILATKIGKDYSYLSNLFSSIEGITIEKFIILQKIEKVKELLVYDELNLSEISYQMNYSSAQHLSSQFKKITGLSPSHFKKLRNQKRNPLDEIGPTKKL